MNEKDNTQLVNKSVDSKINIEVDCSLINILCCFCFITHPYFNSEEETEHINWVEEGRVEKKEMLKRKYGLSYFWVYMTRFLFFSLIFLIFYFGPEYFRNMIVTLFYGSKLKEHVSNIMKDEESTEKDIKKEKNFSSNLKLEDFYDSFLACLVFSGVLVILVILFTKINHRIKSCLSFCVFFGFILSLAFYVFYYNMYYDE